jgi:Fic family protein
MWSFRNKRLLEPVDVTVANLMVALGRYQGRQELYQHQAPQVLETLRRVAIVESTEASNRIEGIEVAPGRLKALIAHAAPQNRSEGEIAGYRDVLARIHTGQIKLPITPDSVRNMHAALYTYLPGEGGQWKQRDNVVRQTLPDGREVVRFVPLPAEETPTAMSELCQSLAETWEKEAVDRLLVTNAFILDFLCIHPFTDGNGRMARLLTLLLYYAAGYAVGRYVSLERIIEQTKETYYEALYRSSQRWDNGQQGLTPWHQYSLSVLVYAYREFETHVNQVTAAPGGKSQAVVSALQTFSPEQTFTIADLERICPAVSRATIRRVLDKLRAEGSIDCLGTGRSARWKKLGTRS